MKITSLFLSFFLFALSTNPLLGAAQPAVLDTDGDEVRPGIDYYILPANIRDGGGLILANRTHLCPLGIVQIPEPASEGLPVVFSPVNPSDPVVNIGTDINIWFDASTICVQSTLWRLTRDTAGRLIVGTGGIQGNPGINTLNNWFNIQRNGDAYNLAYCPGVCDICRPICGDIGILHDNGARRLALGEAPFRVVFRKA